MTFKLCGVPALDKATMDPHGLQPRLPTMDLYRLQPTDPVFDMHQTGAIDKGIEDEIFTSSEVPTTSSELVPSLHGYFRLSKVPIFTKLC